MIPEKPSRQVAQSSSRIEDLIELIDALIDVVVEEYRAGDGAGVLIASCRAQAGVGGSLKWVVEVSMRRVLLHANRAGARVLQRIEALRTSMDENMTRLERRSGAANAGSTR